MPIAAPVAEPAIAIRGLTKRYGTVTAVDGLDLVVEPGQTLALLGPNGAGKTSTVECCEGYRRPDAGSVRVLGLDPIADAAALRSRVGVMLQEGGVYPMAYPGEVLRLFARFWADPLEPDALLAHVGLDGARGTRYRDLSGGQKQRLALALALVGQPEVVFLDEPTAGLDPAARRSTWEHVRHLQEQGVTIVLTTHLLDEAEELADRVAIIDRGFLVAEGTPDELTHGVAVDLTFSTSQSVDVDALAAAVGHDVTADRTGRYRVHAEGTPRLVAEVTAWLADHDVAVGQLNAGKASLEEVFLRLTSEPSAAALARDERRRRRRPAGAAS